MKTCIDGNVNHNINSALSSTVTAILTRATTTATITTTTITKITTITSPTITTIAKTLKISATENNRISSQQQQSTTSVNNSQQHHLEENNKQLDNLQTLTSTDVPVISNVLRYRRSTTSGPLINHHGTDHNGGAITGQTNDTNMTSNMKCLVMTCSTTSTSNQIISSIPTISNFTTSASISISPPLPSTSSPLQSQTQSETISPFKLCKTKLNILNNKNNTATAAAANNRASKIDKFAVVEEFNKNIQSLAQCDSNSSSTTSSVINTSISVHNGTAFKQDINTKANLDDKPANQSNVELDNINTNSIRENSSLSLPILPINTNEAFSIMGNTITTTTSFTTSPETPLSTHSWYSTSSTSTSSIGVYLSTNVHVTSNLNGNSVNTSSTRTPTATSSTTSLIKTTTAPATKTASATISAKKASTISGVLESELLQWQDMPQYLQFNPYVLKGYRPLQTFNGCLLSLFYWHNETVNILTHAIPIVYILAIVPGLMPWDNGYRFLSFCHVFGLVAPWCGSFVYHLFMNIEHGENAYYTLLKLDMVGIWVTQSFGALPLVTATTYCFSQKWKWFIIASYCAMCLWGLYKALTASSPWQRRLCFALPFTMRSILTFLRTLGAVGGNHVALPHVYLQDAVSLVGGAIGAMRIPEKWFPGLVDFYLNSHNIMHVLVVAAIYSMHKATIKDFEWMSSTTCDDNGIAANITTNNIINIEL